MKTRVNARRVDGGRTEAEGKSVARNASSTQREPDALTYLQRIGERAKQKPKEKWTNLLTTFGLPVLKEAYKRLRKAAAPGR